MKYWKLQTSVKRLAWLETYASSYIYIDKHKHTLAHNFQNFRCLFVYLVFWLCEEEGEEKRA